MKTTEEKFESEFANVPDGVYQWQVGEEIKTWQSEEDERVSHIIPLIVDKVIDGAGYEGQRHSWFINLYTKDGTKNEKVADSGYVMLMSGLGLIGEGKDVEKVFGDDVDVFSDEWYSYVQGKLPGMFFQGKLETNKKGFQGMSKTATLKGQAKATPKEEAKEDTDW